jgi:CDP-diacylglycerol--serine O-phosphatidyltransferase
VASLVLCLLKLDEEDKSLSWFALVLPFLMLLIAFLMMSPYRYPSGKNVDMQTRTRLRTFFFLLVLVGLVLLFFKELALLILFLAYIFFGLFRRWRKPRPVRIGRLSPPL